MQRTTLAAAVLAAALAPVALEASSHREAPFVSKFPQVDGTDFYLFKSYEPGRENYVTLIANYVPLQAAYGGPTYFPLDSQARYEIHIDNDGDSREELTFQFQFFDELQGPNGVELTVGDVTQSAVLRNIGPISADSAPGLSHGESYSIGMISNGRQRSRQPVTDVNSGSDRFAKPFDYSGTKTFGGPGQYTNYANAFIHDIDVPGCAQPGRVFVGQRHEAFKLSLGEVFDLVNFVPVEGDSAPGAGDGNGFPGGVTQDPNRNILARTNVTSIAMELHADCLTTGNATVIGGWTTADLPQVSVLNPRPTFERPEVGGGRRVQVSRLSAPLVNELVIGFTSKDRFNASEPRRDAQFLDFVTNPGLPAILDLLFRDAVNATLGTSIANLAPSNLPRTDLVTAFLTGVPGLNAFDDGTPGEMLRLNTAIEPTPRALQAPLGVLSGDLAGFPNGRRPGDDVVDIALRVVMGALCHPLPLGEGGAGVNLGLCSESDAPVGNVPFTDGAPLNASELNNSFPYLLTPYPGSPVDAPLPVPVD